MEQSSLKKRSSERLVNVVWIGLMLLTLSSYLIAEGHFSIRLLTSVILVTAAIKSILISAIFMELKQSPGFFLAFWSLFFAGLSWGINFLFLSLEW